MGEREGANFILLVCDARCARYVGLSHEMAGRRQGPPAVAAELPSSRYGMVWGDEIAQEIISSILVYLFVIIDKKYSYFIYKIL